MLDSLKLIYERLLEETPELQFRFLYQDINLNDRLIG